MPDVRRIAEALREHGTSAIPTWANERICLCGETFRSMPPGPDLADHVADVLLSLPGIVIADLGLVKARMDYNSSDFGELGKYIRLEYAATVLDEEVKRYTS